MPKSNEKKRKCYRCGEEGHLTRNCPKPAPPKSCYNCGSKSHLVRHCPEPAKQPEDGHRSHDDTRAAHHNTNPFAVFKFPGLELVMENNGQVRITREENGTARPGTQN